MIPPINDADIDWAAKVLGGNISFDEESRQFIRCLEPTQVVACPGSGKTTALIAKLLILSRHLPFPGNRGICVLTHTNVAMDEITRRLSRIGSGILSYPSFCGTFQSFVGHFLGHPGYVEEFGHRPLYVDSDIADREVQRWKSRDLMRARRWLEPKKVAPESLRFNLRLEVVRIGKETPFLAENDWKYQAVDKAKKAVLAAGFMFYEDSYVFAYRYLERHPEITVLFRERFPFVFVDEMQDTDQRQLDLLRTLFGVGTSLQLVGDPNQAIYRRTEVGTGCTWKPPAAVLSLPKSLRFDKPIADIVTRLASVTPVSVEGNGTGIKTKPHLLVFSDERITDVIPAFGQLIIRFGLPRLPIRQVYKAVGWVAKEHEAGKHTVPSYWPGFNAARGRERAQYATLKGNLSGALTSTGADFPRRFRRAILTSVARFARTAGVASPSGRHFTETTVREYLDVTAASTLRLLNTCISRLCMEARAGRDVSEDVTAFLVGPLAPHFGADVSLPAVKAFLSEDDSGPLAEQERPCNMEPFEGGAIEISSVHGVKSETHTATLYLDTFYHGYDVHRILPYLKGAMPVGDVSARVKETMKVAFVACSRPSHLLCVSIHADTSGSGTKRNRVTEEDLSELERTWEIVDLR